MKTTNALMSIKQKKCETEKKPSKEMLKLARKELQAKEAKAAKAFVTKIEIDEKLEWL
ncbi:MAG: hypothetical protein AB7F64_05115 [Gammaproteobacteria bacterium]